MSNTHSVVKSNEGFIVTAANGRSDLLSFGAYPSANPEGYDVFRYGNGHTAFTSAGLRKLTSLGLHRSGSRSPNAQSFIASAAAAPTASPAPSTPTAEPPLPPTVAATEPSFIERARQRYGLATPERPAANGNEPNFAQRMRDRYAASEPNKSTDKTAEPDFVARMKARHGVGGDQ